MTEKQLRDMAESIKNLKIKPLEVYICVSGGKTYMVPVSDMPDELDLSPCELVPINQVER